MLSSRGPFRGRMFGDPETKDLSPLVLDDKKDEQNPQTNRRHGEEINGDDIANVIPEEGLPGLRWWPPDRPQQAGYHPFRNLDPQFLQLSVNAWCTPQGI